MQSRFLQSTSAHTLSSAARATTSALLDHAPSQAKRLLLQSRHQPTSCLWFVGTFLIVKTKPLRLNLFFLRSVGVETDFRIARSLFGLPWRANFVPLAFLARKINTFWKVLPKFLVKITFWHQSKIIWCSWLDKRSSYQVLHQSARHFKFLIRM